MEEKTGKIIWKTSNTAIGLAHLGISILKATDPGAYPDSKIHKEVSKMYFTRAANYERTSKLKESLEKAQEDVKKYTSTKDNLFALKLANMIGYAEALLNVYDDSLKKNGEGLEDVEGFVNEYNRVLEGIINEDSCKEEELNERMNKWLAKHNINIKIGQFSPQELETVLENYQHGLSGLFDRLIDERKYENKISAMERLIEREKFLKIKDNGIDEYEKEISEDEKKRKEINLEELGAMLPVEEY